MTIGYVLASLVTSIAVLSSQRNTGSTCYWYESVRVGGGTIWKVIVSEALTINRIYEMYADAGLFRAPYQWT